MHTRLLRCEFKELSLRAAKRKQSPIVESIFFLKTEKTNSTIFKSSNLLVHPLFKTHSGLQKIVNSADILDTVQKKVKWHQI